MPAYNAEHFLQDAIESVRRQTYPCWELLIVDDCSSDGTAEKAVEWSSQDSRIRVLRTGQNSGSSVARNLGLTDCRGRYLAFLDADDIWLPEKLEKQLTFMKDKNAEFSFTSYRKFEASNEGAVISAMKRVSWRDMLKSNVIGCSTVVMLSEAMCDIRFPAGLARQEDYAVWLQVLRKGRLAYGLNEVLTLYRVHPGSKSSRKLRSVTAQWQVYRQLERLSFWRSAWYLGNYAARGLLKRFR